MIHNKFEVEESYIPTYRGPMIFWGCMILIFVGMALGG